MNKNTYILSNYFLFSKIMLIYIIYNKPMSDDDDDANHYHFYDGMGVYLTGPYWDNKYGEGKPYKKATGSKEEFTAYYEGDSAKKKWRIKNSDGNTIGFTTMENFKNTNPPPP